MSGTNAISLADNREPQAGKAWVWNVSSQSLVENLPFNDLAGLVEFANSQLIPRDQVPATSPVDVVVSEGRPAPLPTLPLPFFRRPGPFVVLGANLNKIGAYNHAFNAESVDNLKELGTWRAVTPEGISASGIMLQVALKNGLKFQIEGRPSANFAKLREDLFKARFTVRPNSGILLRFDDGRSSNFETHDIYKVNVSWPTYDGENVVDLLGVGSGFSLAADKNFGQVINEMNGSITR